MSVISERNEILEDLNIPLPSEDKLYSLDHTQVIALQKRYKPLQQGNYTPDSVYKVAEQISDMIDLTAKTNLLSIVRAMGGRITFLPFDEYRSEDGSIFIHSKKEFDIILSNAVSATRTRFTLAHELGHYILHSPKSQSFALRLDSIPVEWEANWFAAGFLMPEKRFLETAKKYRNDTLILAEYFGVSEEAAKIRLEVLQRGK